MKSKWYWLQVLVNWCVIVTIVFILMWQRNQTNINKVFMERLDRLESEHSFRMLRFQNQNCLTASTTFTRLNAYECNPTDYC